MNLNELNKIIEEELKKGSFLPLFYGAIGFEEQLLKYFPSDVPTDWGYVIEKGIYELYKQSQDNDIVELCKKNVVDMLESTNPFSVWCGYNVCWNLITKEKSGKAPFNIMNIQMIENLKYSLNKNKKALSKARIWNGKNLQNGLWSDIERLSKILKEKYQVYCLVDEDGEDKLGIDVKATKAMLSGAIATNMEELLGQKLQEYVDNIWEKKQRLPKAVRIMGMDVPAIDADYGSFGTWKPERAHNVIPKKELEEELGVEISNELYEYYRSWRFASIDWKIENIDITMDPIYENAKGETSFFFTIMLDDTLYFKIGTAYDRKTSIEYTLLYKNSGGVYLLDDEDDSNIIYFAENITALLNNVK